MVTAICVALRHASREHTQVMNVVATIVCSGGGQVCCMFACECCGYVRRYVGAMVLGTTIGRPQANSWTFGRAHSVVNKGDGRLLVRFHVDDNGQERNAAQINSPPEIHVLTYDTTGGLISWQKQC